MLHCKPMPTPLDVKLKPRESASPLADPSLYRGIVGALQYLTITRLDLSYSVNYISQFMHAPTIDHLKLVHCILRLGGLPHNKAVYHRLLYLSRYQYYLIVYKKNNTLSLVPVQKLSIASWQIRWLNLPG